MATRDGRPVLISQVARVIEGPGQTGGQRGICKSKSESQSGEQRRAESGEQRSVVKRIQRGQSLASALCPSALPFSGGPAVLLTINKQPNADTRRVTEQVTTALRELTSSLPADVRLHPEMYQQREFIDRAVHNVIEALRDGGILVVIILFLVLLNFRTTLITLTAIPLSIVITAIVFAASACRSTR